MEYESKVQKTDTCWLWVGTLSGSGYGQIHTKEKRIPAHRYFYEREKGKVPEGLEIDHLCRVRKCVNPAHLEAVTHRENVRRGWEVRLKTKPNCPHGHPYSGENLYIKYNKRRKLYQRICRECSRETVRKCRANK